jgi:hypothetical protein
MAVYPTFFGNLGDHVWNVKRLEDLTTRNEKFEFYENFGKILRIIV